MSREGPTAHGETVLWLTDVSAVTRADAARSEASAKAETLREAIETLPLPVWRRDAGLRIVDCNTAYAAALDTTRETALAEARELAAESGRNRALLLARKRRRVRSKASAATW